MRSENFMKPNQLDISKIHPKRGEKFSPNLHSYLKQKENANFREHALIFRNVVSGHLWIGYKHEGEFIGLRLMEVLCNGRHAQRCCYTNINFELQELPKFWEQYLSIGRCAIDTEHREHFMNAAERYEEAGEVRTCRWCGRKQRQRKWTETVQHIEWVNSL